MADSIRGPLHNSSSPREHEPSKKDKKENVDKLLKWQQDRIERKLRGEYESAVLHLGEVISGNLNTPVTLSAVRVEGAINTRKSFLKAIIDPVISPLPTSGSHTSGSGLDSDSGSDSTTNQNQISTLQDILHATRSISSSLRKTDIFSSVEAYIDRPKDALVAGKPADGDVVDLVFKTKEKGRFYVSSSTELGNSEGSANLTTRVRNIFGGAETFEASLALGTKTRRSFRSSFTAPLPSFPSLFPSSPTNASSASFPSLNPSSASNPMNTPSNPMNTQAILETYAQEKDLTSYASCWEATKGVKAYVRSGEVDGRGMHEVGWEGVRRDLSVQGGGGVGGSISIREQAGPSIKSSLSHTYVWDTRDDRIAASRGGYVRVFQEVAGVDLGMLADLPSFSSSGISSSVSGRGAGGANGGGEGNTGLGAIGLGGDAKYYKLEVEGQVSRTASALAALCGFGGFGGLGGSGSGVSISLAARSGLLWGLSSPFDGAGTSDQSQEGLEGAGIRKPTTLFSDRFQLGGPTSVRGFKANGMGPRDGNDSLGGQIYYSAGISVISDVPSKKHWPVKMHGWVNAGRLDGVDQTLPLSQTLAQTLSQPSISAGVGLIYRFDPVRLEVNFGVPVVKSRSDRGTRGVQVGMGLEFM